MSRERRITEPVPEEVVRLSVNGAWLAPWTASPDALEALAAGRLLALGYLLERTELLEIERTLSDHGVHQLRVQVTAAAEARGRAEREHRSDHGCGLRFLLDCRRDQLPDRTGRAAPPPLDDFAPLFRALFERSPSRETTGGHHTAALSDGRGLLHVHEEVGRHNAVDKAFGAAFLAGDDPAGLGLVTTARISAEIAEKAARAGAAWVASRSVPTTLAVEIAAAAGIPIVARAAGRDARVLGGEP